ncbi:MAG TPA: outer membrane beta-barrel protein [Kofleriaceae bacterium]|nr:outer membrane beta-barrel protein [Kofleriaceae bacterium]
MKNLSLGLSSLAAAATLFTAGSALTANEASADVRVRIGGSAHVRIGGPRVRVVRPYYRYRPVHRPTVYVGGHIWLGGGYYYDRPFAQPPPPPPPADCNCDGQYYGPIAPAPATYVSAPVVIEQPLPRWGIGAFMGGVSVDGEHEGEDVGLIGQFRLTRGLLLEGEIAKNTLEDGGRVDRRMMAGLKYELGAERRWAPYLAAGIGTTQVEVEGGWQDSQAVAEVGAGLRWRLSPSISLFGDMRFGSRESIEETPTRGDGAPPTDDTSLRSLVPESEESFSRVRLGGMVTF